jgi:hypothetical protein
MSNCLEKYEVREGAGVKRTLPHSLKKFTLFIDPRKKLQELAGV